MVNVRAISNGNRLKYLTQEPGTKIQDDKSLVLILGS